MARADVTPSLEKISAERSVSRVLIRAGEPRVVRRADPDADPAEAALLERLGFGSLLMLPLRSHGQSWGLVEICGDDRVFDQEEIATAASIVDRVGEVLAVLEQRISRPRRWFGGESDLGR